MQVNYAFGDFLHPNANTLHPPNLQVILRLPPYPTSPTITFIEK
ncbi:hypothetical protein FM103_02280 [Corynebacterium xerosis]|nr:hypothetical protein FM103_02280 [Corynebacterium xerosis]